MGWAPLCPRQPPAVGRPDRPRSRAGLSPSRPCGGAIRPVGAVLKTVDERRNPKTRATVNQFLDRYLETLDVMPTTRTRNRGIIRVHLRRALGSLPLSKLDGDVLDRFFAQLRCCRERCGGRGRHEWVD